MEMRLYCWGLLNKWKKRMEKYYSCAHLKINFLLIFLYFHFYTLFLCVFPKGQEATTVRILFVCQTNWIVKFKSFDLLSRYFSNIFRPLFFKYFLTVIFQIIFDRWKIILNSMLEKCALFSHKWPRLF